MVIVVEELKFNVFMIVVFVIVVIVLFGCYDCLKLNWLDLFFLILVGL